jgi:hypothetical protein
MQRAEFFMPLGTLIFFTYINIFEQKLEMHNNSITAPAYLFNLSITTFPYYIKNYFKITLTLR